VSRAQTRLEEDKGVDADAGEEKGGADVMEVDS
jgi:hypothetical protein